MHDSPWNCSGEKSTVKEKILDKKIPLFISGNRGESKKRRIPSEKYGQKMPLKI
jgi:hypothetical protein